MMEAHRGNRSAAILDIELNDREGGIPFTPMENLYPCPQLAALLEERQAEIQSDWVDLLQGLSGSRYQEMSERDLSSWTAAGVAAITESLHTGSKEPLITHAVEFSRVLTGLGFAINEVLEGLLMVREAALEHLLAARAQSATQSRDPLRQFDATLRVLISRMARLIAETLSTVPGAEPDSGDFELASGTVETAAPAVDDARSHTATHKLLIESQKLQKAAESLLEMQGLDDVIEIICREAEKLTSARGSAIYLAEKGAVATQTFMHGEAVSRSDEDLVSGSHTDGSLLRLPLTVRGHNLGTLVLVGQERGLGEEESHLASRFADQAAIAIQHGLLHQQHQKLVILEERQKLAHELHDSATQSIYGVTMYAEAAARLLEANQLERASTILRDLQETALDALREMRLLVFELRPPMLEKEGLAAALQARLSAVEGRAGLVTEFSADNVGSPPYRVAEAFYGIAKEALNNVLKHAEASHVSIRLRQLESAIALEITDDGAGFEMPVSTAKSGLGLKGMKERAGGVGAELTISSRTGNGTTVRVEVPLQEPDAGSRASGGTK